MSVLFGHPAGNPNAYNAALAHFESGNLHAFCVPWLPSPTTVRLLRALGRRVPAAQRLARRSLPGLEGVPTFQGRHQEFGRLFRRMFGANGERIAGEANRWLMRTMAQHSRDPGVTALHSFEDCSLDAFVAGKRAGKACIYDLPIGYGGAWRDMEEGLANRYADWMPRAPVTPPVELAQKAQEIELADLVLVASGYAERTVRSFHPDKRVARAAYGVDLAFWKPAAAGPSEHNELRFIYTGHLSLRKGTPLLLEAWRKAAVRDARLVLVGPWRLADTKLSRLPAGVNWVGPCGPVELREHYRRADVFVFPSFFEGFGLVLLEAMACGLPAIASHATAGPDILNERCGRVVSSGDLDGLIESFRWFDRNRDRVPDMRRAARAQAETYPWSRYRRQVTAATRTLLAGR